MFDGVAQFVYDNIISKFGRQMHESPVEVQISKTRTTAPDTTVIFYAYSLHHERLDTLPVRNTTCDERAGNFAVPQVLGARHGWPWPDDRANNPTQRHLPIVPIKKEDAVASSMEHSRCRYCLQLGSMSGGAAFLGHAPL